MNLEQLLSNVTNPTNRLFGVEIELNGLTPRMATDFLSRAGVPVREEGYNHTRRSWWKVTTDGSLSGRERSCEVVSPPLPFNVESLKLVAAVIRTLKAAGGTVDSTCGIHVHVDSRDLVSVMADFSRAIFLRYRECEDIIDQMVASSRRTDSNRFCRTLKVINRNSQYSTLRYDRYQKVNFNSFERHGTIEFRQHEGCLEDVKVVAWIVFCVTFFEQTRIYFNERGREELQEARNWE